MVQQASATRKTALAWKLMRYTMAGKLKDDHPSSENNAQHATADGTPAWITLNLKSNVSFSNIERCRLALKIAWTTTTVTLPRSFRRPAEIILSP